MKKKGKYLIKSLKSSMEIALLSRLFAKGIDFFIILILSFFFYPIGVIIGAAYLAIGDSLQNGQSVGKKFIGLCVISLEDGSPCSFKQSAVRNLPIIIPLVFAVVPIWGWILSFFLGFPLIIVEIYLIFSLDSRHRIGDVMADTTVIASSQDKMPVGSVKRGWFDTKTSHNSV